MLIKTKPNKNGQVIQTISGKAGPGGIFYSREALCRNTGIYEWSFKCEKMASNDMIGIVSSLERISTEQYALDLPGVVHFWWAHAGVWKNHERSAEKWNHDTQKSYGKWDTNDTVTLQLDTDKNILTMKLNGEIVFAPLDLHIEDKNAKVQNDEIEWYPFIQASSLRSKYIHIV